jgi:hypothetical protein
MYRGSRDGFFAKDFHDKCDGHSNTLTIFKPKVTPYIFGGFTSAEWGSVYFEEYKSDPFAFVFSLINKDNKPFKSLIKQNNNGFAILSSATKGPSFGQSYISIGNSSNDKSNWANLGHSYDNPPENIDKKYLLAGSSLFELSEIEVYKRE